MIVASCSGLLKKNDADAGATATTTPDTDAAAPTPAPTAGAIAANEGDVARFPDETAASGTAVLMRSYNVREAPPAGPVIAGLTKGATVTKIAARGFYFLITYDKPGAPGTKQLGWIHRDAFSAVIADAGPLVCPTGEIALFGDTPFCGKLCSADNQCPAQQACKGSAAKLLPTGKAGDTVSVCTAWRPPPTPASDAGPAPPTPPPPAVVDAGHPTPPAPAPTGDVVPATNGTCAVGYLLVKKTGKCHRSCAASPAACKNQPNFCIKCDSDNKKVCAEARDQCK
jgi:hypothetical protein